MKEHQFRTIAGLLSEIVEALNKTTNIHGGCGGVGRGEEDTIKDQEKIIWALNELPKLAEGKDFREDTWDVIVEKLKDKLSKGNKYRE